MKTYKRYKFTRKECVKGGKKGIKVVLSRLTPEQRKLKAIKAVTVRWTREKISTGNDNKQ